MRSVNVNLKRDSKNPNLVSSKFGNRQRCEEEADLSVGQLWSGNLPPVEMIMTMIVLKRMIIMEPAEMLRTL